MHMKSRLILGAAVVAALASAASAGSIVVDGTISGTDASALGAAVKTYSQTGPTSTVSSYFTYDNAFVYGAIHLDSGTSAFPGSNVYVYSSTANHLYGSGTAGSYGDGNDVLIEGANGWGYGDSAGLIGGIHYTYAAGTVNYAFNGTDTVEFSIARSLLGNYDSFRFGGQLFNYEFHLGGTDAGAGALVSVAAASVPTPAALVSAPALLGLVALRRKRR